MKLSGTFKSWFGKHEIVLLLIIAFPGIALFFK